MTKEEAILFFPCKDEDDFQEIYEDLFFEYKQFFLSKPPIRKVFLAKKVKMQKMHEAYLLIAGKEDVVINNEMQKFEYTFSNSILDTFNLYQHYRNELKIKILKSNNSIELTPIIDQILRLQSIYSEIWGEFEISESENIIISKEIDPMYLLLAIQEFNKLGGITFKDLHLKINISPILLINEAKRLSLCRKLEKNG